MRTMDLKLTLFGCIIYSYLLQSCQSKAVPSKIQITYDDPLLTVPCNFENGLCPGYEVDTTSYLQWLLQQGPTSSQLTGPSYDKTLGKGRNGWYVYVESSNQLSGRIARLETRVLDHTRTHGEKLCLSFHYHMFGHTIGEFSVYFAVLGAGKEEKYFHLAGNQFTKEWQLGRFSFDTPDKPFKIIFEGTSSFSYFGDIGLDEINLHKITPGQTCDFWPTVASTNKLTPTKPNIPPLAGLSPTVPFTKISSIGDNLTCGRRRIGMGRIANGDRVTTIGKWPWMVIVQRKKAGGSFDHNCGGTLLGNQWVITAAHCVVEIGSYSHLRVRLGTHMRDTASQNTQQIGIKGIYIHPKYNTVTRYNNDIALLELDRPAMLNNYVESICLPRDKIQTERKCVIAGWGKTWEIVGVPSSYSDHLLQGYVRTKKIHECKQQYNDRITDNMLCAGPDSNYSDTCEGDSGGPLMCENSDGSWSLTGITSWGHNEGCGMGNLGVYTDMEKMKKWVQQTVANPQSASKLH